MITRCEEKLLRVEPQPMNITDNTINCVCVASWAFHMAATDDVDAVFEDSKDSKGEALGDDEPFVVVDCLNSTRYHFSDKWTTDEGETVERVSNVRPYAEQSNDTECRKSE